MKRIIFGIGAALSAGVLTVSSAFAVDPLDYANSVGQVDDADTYNWVIEATKDGGYIAGGQTVGCFKEEIGETRGLYGSEAADMQECIDYYEANPDDVWWDTNGSLITEFCEMDSGGPRLYGGKGASDHYYFYSCVDYAAKFKQDGTKEWLTTLEDGEHPVAVGETNNDYRLITSEGTIHTLSKNDGVEGISGQLNMTNEYYLKDAIINDDGSTTVYGQRQGIALYGANGNLVRSIPKYTETDNSDIYVGNDYMSGNLSKNLVRSNNGFVTLRATTTYEEDPDTGDYTTTGVTYEIIEISPDLRSVTPIVTLEDSDDIGMIMPLSADNSGNVLALTFSYDETTDDDVVQLVSYNQNGQQIAAKNVEEVFNIDPDTGSINDTPKFLDGFTVMDPITNGLRRFSPQLEEIYSYSLAEGESVNDVVLLTDGSLAGVGGSTRSTTNYNVDGAMNGTYLRLAAANTNGGTTNPQTDDEDIKVYIAVGVAVVLLAYSLIIRASKRRRSN